MKPSTCTKLRALGLAALMLLPFTGCGSGEKPAASSSGATTTAPTAQRPTAATPNADGSTAEGDTLYVDFAPQLIGTAAAYVPAAVTPNAPEYTINPDLSNIVNLDQFSNLTEQQRAAIANNGFVVSPGSQEQLFYIYEDNTYKKIPNFVTTDSVLQVYHIFFDYSLRSVEAAALYPAAVKLNANMLMRLIEESDSITDPEVKEQALLCAGYFGVAQLAFGEPLPSSFPADIKARVEQEYALLEAANGYTQSPLFGYEIDYSLLAPRGHYTRSEELKAYFRGMGWYGVVPYPLYNADGTRNVQAAMRAIITTVALCRLEPGRGGDLWESIYSPTCFYVGSADDPTPYDFAKIVTEVYGSAPDLNAIAGRLDEFYEAAKSLPQSLINARLDLAKSQGREVVSGPQFRFMGQRYIPDSEVLQELSAPVVRPFPTGLDVFAAFGSQRAADIINEVYQPAQAWPEYTQNMSRMLEKFTNLPDATWQSNMYYGWLHTLRSLTGEYGKGWPLFMRGTAWQDKSLATALGSWAELRHDTILYAKGSAAECGGFDQPPVVYAYVEPNVELYGRLLHLTQASREGLRQRGMLPESIEYAMDGFENMLTFLRGCVEKELRGEDLSIEEYDSLLTYGGTLEYLTSTSTENGAKWYQIESETDRNMAVIADVHTATPGGYLEEAVGTAADIYVAVPINGQVYLTRGAVFDYFEFVSQQRMTDEQWQARLKTGAPERPPWTASFMEQGGGETPAPAEPYTTGC